LYWPSLKDVLDVLIISFLVYRVLLLLSGTRAVHLLRGIVFLVLLGGLAKLADLRAFSFLMSRFIAGLFVVIPIVFQPELRRIFEEIGRGGLVGGGERSEAEAERWAGELVRAIAYLKDKRIGALLVLQRRVGLKEHWSRGVLLDSILSSELVISIFWPNNPLHDGAVVIDGSRVIAAACYLPLSDDPSLSTWLGTRHRAALGISEVSDALSLVISEERGEISLAAGGKLARNLSLKQLERILLHYYSRGKEPRRPLLEGLLRLFLPPRSSEGSGLERG